MDKGNGLVKLEICFTVLLKAIDGCSAIPKTVTCTASMSFIKNESKCVNSSLAVKQKDYCARTF